MAVSGEAPVEVVSIIKQGTLEVVQSNFGSFFEVVELATDSESVAEVRGHGIGFDPNRSTVTPRHAFLLWTCATV